MQKFVRLLCTAVAVLPTACATPGGGPFGMVAFDPKHHVSGAEPLFGVNDERCLDDPTFMLTIYAPGADQVPATNDPCARMRWAIIQGLRAHGTEKPEENDRRGRNEVIDGLMTA